MWWEKEKYLYVIESVFISLLLEPKTARPATLRTASCVCVSTTVEPNSIKTSQFVLAWHMPVVKFGLGQKEYLRLVISFFTFQLWDFILFRYYTKWFDKSTLTGSTLCIYTLKNRTKWEEDIAKWQQPILDDP